jgi:hypothetical protein
MHKQSRYLVLIDIPHEDVQVIVNLNLVLETLAHIRDKETIALFDQLNVKLVVVGLSVNSLFDNLEGNLSNIK